jgi:hypothetical protein
MQAERPEWPNSSALTQPRFTAVEANFIMPYR